MSQHIVSTGPMRKREFWCFSCAVANTVSILSPSSGWYWNSTCTNASLIDQICCFLILNSLQLSSIRPESVAILRFPGMRRVTDLQGLTARATVATVALGLVVNPKWPQAAPSWEKTVFGTGVPSDLPSATRGTSRFFTETLRRWLVSPNRICFLVKKAKIACFGVFAAYLITTVPHLLRPPSFLSALIDLIRKLINHSNTFLSAVDVRRQRPRCRTSIGLCHSRRRRHLLFLHHSRGRQE